MPPPNFKSVTVTNEALYTAHRIRRLIVEIGTASLPEDAIPPEYRKKTDGFAIGEIFAIALLAFEKRILDGQAKKLKKGARGRVNLSGVGIKE